MPPPNPTPNPFPRDSSFWVIPDRDPRLNPDSSFNVLPGGDHDFHPHQYEPEPAELSTWDLAPEESRCEDNRHPYRVLLHLITKRVYRIPGPCRDPECVYKMREAVMRGDRIVQQINAWVSYYHLPHEIRWTVLDGSDKQGYDRIRKQVYRSHGGRGWGIAHRMLLPRDDLPGLEHKTVIASSIYDLTYAVESVARIVPTSPNLRREGGGEGGNVPIYRSGDNSIFFYMAIIPRLLLAKKPKIHTSRINLPTTDPVARYGCPICGGVSWVNNLETCLLHDFPVRSNNLSLGWESKMKGKTIHTMLKQAGYKVVTDGTQYESGVQVYKVEAIN